MLTSLVSTPASAGALTCFVRAVGAGGDPSFGSGGVSRCQHAVHQASDQRLAGFLVILPNSLFRQRREHPRLSSIQALQRRLYQVLWLHHCTGREITQPIFSKTRSTVPGAISR